MRSFLSSSSLCHPAFFTHTCIHTNPQHFHILILYRLRVWLEKLLRTSLGHNLQEGKFAECRRWAVSQLLFSFLTDRRQCLLSNVTRHGCQKSWPRLNSHSWLCCCIKAINLLQPVLCQTSLETALNCCHIYDKPYVRLRISLVRNHSSFTLPADTGLTWNQICWMLTFCQIHIESFIQPCFLYLLLLRKCLQTH